MFAVTCKTTYRIDNTSHPRSRDDVRDGLDTFFYIQELVFRSSVDSLCNVIYPLPGQHFYQKAIHRFGSIPYLAASAQVWRSGITVVRSESCYMTKQRIQCVHKTSHASFIVTLRCCLCTPVPDRPSFGFVAPLLIAYGRY